MWIFIRCKRRKGACGRVKVLHFLKPYVGHTVAAVILVLVNSVTQLILPTLMAEMINNGIAKGDLNYIYKIGAWMLIVSGIVVVTAVALSYCSSMASAGFGTEARRQVFRKTESFSLSDVDKIGTASLITRTTNDIRQIQDLLLMGIRVIISAPFMLIGGAVMAFVMNKTLSIVIFILIPIIGAIAFLASRFVMPLFDRQQKKIDRLNAIVREKISGIRVIRAFNRSDYEDARFEQSNEELASIAKKINRLFAVLVPVLMIVLYFTIVVLVFIGAKQVEWMDLATQASEIAQTVGNLQAFILYVIMIIGAVSMAAGLLVMLPRAKVSARRIMEVMNMENDIRPPAEPKKPDGSVKGVVEFRHVSFRYPGEQQDVLHDISFRTEPGTVTAIIGSTGSGKSSVINLIPRFYDVSAGSISVDGVDVRDMEASDLHARLGLIPQQAFLFSGTIADNLRYGKEDATPEEMWEALDTACAAEFVRERDRGLEERVSQNANNLSGGQKQRLAIARALIKKAEIYIFDDSFSALDFKTDAAVRANIRRRLSDCAMLIVAQRVGTILTADRILVLDGGRVVGDGKHEELMKTCAAYREIALSQLSREEAGA